MGGDVRKSGTRCRTFVRQRLEVLLRAQYEWMDKNRDTFLFFVRWGKPICERDPAPQPTDWYVPRMATG